MTVRYQSGPNQPVLANVPVELRGPSGGIINTDAGGQSRFNDLPPGGGYEVVVDYRCTTRGSQATSVTEDQTTPVTIVVQPVGTLSGRVTDVTNPGTGVAGATVTLSGAASRTATTNASGAYSFDFLTPGNYQVTATKPGFTTHNRAHTANFSPCGAETVDLQIQQIVLEITNRATGAVISGTTVQKVVGNKIRLGLQTRPLGHAISSPQWTIPGTRVKGYTQSAAAGTKTDVTAADLQAPTIDFHWIAGGSHVVQASAQVAGATLTATVTFTILAPTDLSMTSVTGAVGVGNPGFPGSGTELHFGTNATPGITWTFTAKAPAGGAGQIAGTQLANTLRLRTDPTAVPPLQTFSSGGAWMLDNTVPYAAAVAIAAGASATWTSDDTPGTPLTAPYVQRSVTDSFQIYFMYQSSEADSIWVTLGLLTWNWNGQADLAAGVWSLTSSGRTANPAGAASTALPVWTANVTGIVWR
ncbi:MAG: carboxypeptidase regulatory-like domain-containing protein [Bryobacterales bacterium]|nr:carboxypeptidase regulatory-like domain-containing protein [Bryobacterales bacterium]